MWPLNLRISFPVSASHNRTKNSVLGPKVCGKNLFAISRVVNAANLVGDTRKLPNFFAGFQVPPAQRTIVAAGNQSIHPRGKCYRLDAGLMSLQGLRHLARFDLADADNEVAVMSRGELLTITGEGQTQRQTGVQDLAHLLGLDQVHLDQGASGNQYAPIVRSEGNPVEPIAGVARANRENLAAIDARGHLLCEFTHGGIGVFFSRLSHFGQHRFAEALKNSAGFVAFAGVGVARLRIHSSIGGAGAGTAHAGMAEAAIATTSSKYLALEIFMN